MVLNDFKNTSTSSILPLKLQEYLWQQTRGALKSKLHSGHSGYEATCVALERMICGDKTKELKVQVPDVFSAIKSIPKWTFVKGALPYVIHCCAAILEQRRQLGLSDKLSVAVTKIFATLHWILLEASQECCEDGFGLDLNVIELFIQALIPNVHNLFESDLTFSLQVGGNLWHPLWSNSPPLGSILATPILLKKGMGVSKKSETQTLLPPSLPPEECHNVATYFDVALVKVMMLENWTLNGYKWGLQYLQNYLKTILSRYGFDADNCIVLGILSKFAPRKSVLPDSGVESRQPSPTMNYPHAAMHSNRAPPNIKLNEKIPADILDFVTADGDLKLPYILKMLKKLVKNQSLWSVCGSLLFLICQLTELTLDTQKLFNTLRSHFESLLFCYVNIAKMLGCEHHCQNRLKGIKGDHFRYLLQAYLQRVINTDINRSKIWFQKYIQGEKPGEVMEFLHALFGFCVSSPQVVYPKSSEESNFHSYIRGMSNVAHDILNQQEYVEQKHENEKLILSWVGHLFHKNMTESWNDVIETKNLDCFIAFVQFTRYIQIRHPLIFRKIVMSGLLNSFDKSKESDTANAPVVPEEVVPEIAGSVPEPSSSSYEGKSAKSKHKKNWFGPWLQKSVTIDNVMETPEGSYADMSSTLPAFAGRSNYMAENTTGSLPRYTSKGSSKVKDFGLVSKKDTHGSNAQPHGVRGKLINSKGLYDGLKQFRCLLDVTPPGLAPEEAVVTAMLDLEAPIVARAAYLLELAHFVHRCNNGEWPALIQFSQQGPARKGLPDCNLLNGMKHRAGLLFHKWGVVIGRKLEDILLQERVHDHKKYKNDQQVELMYQGNLSVVSSACPQALRLVACQLLLEITAFLRETFVLSVQIHMSSMDASSPRSRTHTNVSLTLSGNRKKHSIAAALAKKIQRRKSSVGYMLTSPVPVSKDETVPQSPSRVRRNQSIAYLTKKSPKVARKFSRKISRPSFDRQASLTTMFAEDQDELPEEMLDFPWLNVMMQMNKSIDFLCAHGADKCADNCPVGQLKSCFQLVDALKIIYDYHNHQVIENYQDENISSETKVDPVYNYLVERVGILMQLPFSVLCKGAFVMENQQLGETMASSWEVLLYPCQQLRAAAASLFLVSGIRLEVSISNFLTRELTSIDAHNRANAIQRFGVLWDCQYQVYEHLEDSAKATLRIPFPRREYTLPSRPLGLLPEPVPDAAWVADSNVHQDLDLSDDEDEFYYLDSEQQKEVKAKKRAKKLKKLREKYFLTSIPFSYQASVESEVKDDEDQPIVQNDHMMQPFFPPSMNHGFSHLIHLLDDTAVATTNGQTVGSLSRHVIWKCLVDDSDTFFRRFYEKITRISKQDELILLLRKLLMYIPELPPYAAQQLLNNLVGVIVYHDRLNIPGTQERIAAIFPLLWQIAPSVDNVYFADLKQSLRREHIDNILMVTANVACTTEVSVVYTAKERLNIFEEMTFKELLTQSKGIFEIESDVWLVDKHSGAIMENNNKIRDVYVFKRGYPSPSLKLEEMSEEHAFSKRQQQAVTNKLLQINQLKFTSKIFEKLPNKKHVTFLYSELFQQVSFPKKAIDIEFDLCMGDELGLELFYLDVIFKDYWVKFIWSLLTHLSEATHYGEEMIGLFLDPVNGALLLHCEDVTILRSCLAALINIVMCYGKIFALDAYQEILPTLLKVYSHHEDNTLVKEAIEFTVLQFYNYHQSQFILQMFSSAAPILLTEDMLDVSMEQQFDMVPSHCLFNLVESLERDVPDTLDIMSLVRAEKPIKPYDDCLVDDTNRSGKIDLSIRLALTIIAYKSESSRALQMMFVLSAIIPHYLRHLEALSEAHPLDNEPKKNEFKQIKSMMKYVATIIGQNQQLTESCEILGNITSNRSTDATSRGRGNFVWEFFRNAMSALFGHTRENMQEGDEVERASIYGEGENPYLISSTNTEEYENLAQFYQPRTVLLSLASDFTVKCAARYKMLLQEVKGKSNIVGLPDIIEDENALVLIDVASTLLELVLCDHEVLRNPGLQRFLLEAMPHINWSNDVAPFSVIVKRMERLFRKILQKPDYMKYVEWDSLEVLLRGLYLTLKRQEALADIPVMMLLLHTCTKIVIDDAPETSDHSPTAGLKSPSSIAFNTTVVKLAARLLYIRPKEYNLESNFAMYTQGDDARKIERFLVHWLLPLAIRMGTGRVDYPCMPSDDIHFVSNVLLSFLLPSNTIRPSMAITSVSVVAGLGMPVQSSQPVLPSMTKICFLGMKILLTSYSDCFGRHWKTMKNTIVRYMENNESDLVLWNFISFLVCHRLPLFVHLLPTVRKKLAFAGNSLMTRVQVIHNRIKHDLLSPPVVGCRSSILQLLLNELSSIENLTVENEDTESSGSGDPELALANPPTGRGDHEDDQSYIKRVMKQLRTSRKQNNGDEMLDRKSQHSIIKRTYTNPFSKQNPHAKLKKQVSFHDSVSPSHSSLDVESVTSPVSPLRKQLGKLSKRSKLRMFTHQKRQDEDDQDIIINHDSIVGGENTVDGSSQSASAKGVTRQRKNASYSKESKSTQGVLSDIASRKNFFPNSSSTGDSSSALVMEKNMESHQEIDDTESEPTSGQLLQEFAKDEIAGATSKEKTFSLSRSPALKRFTAEGSSIKIQGLPSRPTNDTSSRFVHSAMHEDAPVSDATASKDTADKAKSNATSPISSKRKLPSPPSFDESRIVEIHRKISTEHAQTEVPTVSPQHLYTVL